MLLKLYFGELLVGFIVFNLVNYFIEKELKKNNIKLEYKGINLYPGLMWSLTFFYRKLFIIYYNKYIKDKITM